MGDSPDKPSSLADRLPQLRRRVLGSSREVYELKIQIAGNGFGTVRRVPDAESYDKGQVVSLTAIPENGSRFVRWLNNATGSHPVCNLRMDSDKWVFAEFTLVGTTPELERTESMTLDTSPIRLYAV